VQSPTVSPALLAQLVAALEQADLYLNSYDTSRPSRIKAETRGSVEEAIGAVKALLGPGANPAHYTAGDVVATLFEGAN
jgi:hypothetical protein